MEEEPEIDEPPQPNKRSTITDAKQGKQFTYSHLKHVKPGMSLVERTALYSNIPCPHCGRLFNKKAAQRHIA